jgi:hypothetical protein
MQFSVLPGELPVFLSSERETGRIYVRRKQESEKELKKTRSEYNKREQ